MLREVLYKCEEFMGKLSTRHSLTALPTPSPGKARPTEGAKQRGLQKQARILSFSRHFRAQDNFRDSDGSGGAEAKKRARSELIRSRG